jgi:hypothetical protein
VPSLAWRWDSLAAEPSSGGPAPGGLGPGWVLARPLDHGLVGWLAGSGRPLVLAAAVLPAVVWVRRRPRRVHAAVGLVLLAPLALGPAWSPRDLVWPAVFGYLGDARWASIYAVTAGATLLWTSTWWGAGLPWHGGVDPATLPDGTVAGLGLVTWAVLGSWLVLGWRTVAVEAAAAPGPAPAGSGAPPGLARPRGLARSRGLWTTGRTPPPGRLRSPPGGRTPAGVSSACPGTGPGRGAVRCRGAARCRRAARCRGAARCPGMVGSRRMTRRPWTRALAPPGGL